jgi:L-asparaginase
MPLRFFVTLLLVVVSVDTPWAGTQQPLPTVMVIATGGTIAGEQQEPGTLGRYDVKRGVRELVAAVPAISRYAQIESEQFSNVSSSHITPQHWLALAQRINALLDQRADLAGVVVTHGTSRLEETAFFLHLTVKSDRPVVVVGAQRPSTGVSPDGPLNLLSAIRVAASTDARNKGALAVMDDRIISARDVTKNYGHGGGFGGAEMGVLGTVSNFAVEFFYQPIRRHTRSSEFDVSSLRALPRVDIAYSYGGAPGLADPAAKAMIVATTGLSEEEGRYFDARKRNGLVVATTFPSGMSDRLALGEQNSAAASPNSAQGPPYVAVKHLMPTKARILMMLALTKTQDPVEIQRIFNSY